MRSVACLFTLLSLVVAVIALYYLFKGEPILTIGLAVLSSSLANISQGLIRYGKNL